MGFFEPSPPPFDLEEWRAKPYLTRLKLNCQDWAVNGFAPPDAVYLLYIIKLIGARRTYLIGTGCLAAGCLGLSLAVDTYQLAIASALRHCAGFMAIPGSGTIRRMLPASPSCTSCCGWRPVSRRPRLRRCGRSPRMSGVRWASRWATLR